MLFFFFSLSFQKTYSAPASPHKSNKHRAGKTFSVQPDSFLMLLAGKAALLAPALIYSLEEGEFLQVEARQGKARDISFYFLLQVVILLEKQENHSKTKKNTYFLPPINKTQLGTDLNSGDTLYLKSLADNAVLNYTPWKIPW